MHKIRSLIIIIAYIRSSQKRSNVKNVDKPVGQDRPGVHGRMVFSGGAGKNEKCPKITFYVPSEVKKRA
ncbi:hypothetical protein WN55_04598 [Dufourea novaeangliae]|uniref:Uncharacterized protein n=1 Tax=Dufourea novaeangliae TaxID=178035 RepID=A0A154P342_DUFNO|nr:hypothetical protein WN55_04598 [Dufourea novaeangliae]